MAEATPLRFLVAQSGGPTPVVNASVVGFAREIADLAPGATVYGARYGFVGAAARDWVDLTALSDAALDTLCRTPGAALGSSRYRQTERELEALAISLQRAGVAGVALIGGNDSADTLHRLHVAARAKGVPLTVVGIPKTIDNDLPAMDHCPGYGSAARYLALAAREAGLDAAAMRASDPVKVIEVMGRNAGWLVASAALARREPGDAPQVLFFPERPLALETMVRAIEAAVVDRGYAVAVICENHLAPDGSPLAGGQPTYVDPHGHPYFDSPGRFLARKVEELTGLRARYERPGSLQRTSQAALSETDVREAMAAGAAAARLCLEGASDLMVTLERVTNAPYRVRNGTVPLTEVAARERRLPREFMAEHGYDVTPAFIEYAAPLIGGPLPDVLTFV